MSGGDTATRPRRPTSAPQLPWYAVVVLVIGILGGAGAVAFQWRGMSQKDAEQRGEITEPVTLDLATAGQSDGVRDRFGSGSTVVVYAVTPPMACHDSAIKELRRLAANYPEHMQVLVLMMGSQAAKKAKKSTCAGYVVNGHERYTYTKPDGTERSVYFDGAPRGTWTVEDLRAVVLEELRKAGIETKPESEEIEPPPPDDTGPPLPGQMGHTGPAFPPLPPSPGP